MDGEIGSKTQVRLIQFVRLKNPWREHNIYQRKFDSEVELMRAKKLIQEEQNKILEAKGQPT